MKTLRGAVVGLAPALSPALSPVLMAGALLAALLTPAAPCWAQGELGFQLPRPLSATAATDSGSDRLVHLAAGANDVWIAAWESNDVSAEALGGDLEIFWARSTNNGLNWSAPTHHLFAGADGVAPDHDPSVATNGAGIWIIAWSSFWVGPGNSWGGDPDILYIRSSDHGATWGPTLNLNDTAPRDDCSDIEECENFDVKPALACDGSVWIAAWTLETAGGVGGFFGVDSDILFARSVDNGVNWSNVSNLNSDALFDDATFDRDVQLAPGGNGVWVAAWAFQRENESLGTHDAGIVAARSANGGVTWSSPIALDFALNSPDVILAEPSLALDGAGNWLAAWRSNRDSGGSDADLWVARSTNNGLSWSAAQRLQPGGAINLALEERPRLASNGAGEWRAIWAEREFSSTLAWRVRASRSLDVGQTWSNAQLIDLGQASFAGADAYELNPAPTLRFHNNRWIAAWHSLKLLCADTANSDADIAFSPTSGSGGLQPANLTNISTRGPVGSGNNVMIAGFIIEGTAPKSVLINGRGPSLTPFGVPNALGNPVLALFSGQQQIGFNDDWRSNSAVAVEAIINSGRGPTNDREAALLVGLNPGAYTVHLAGANSGIGNGLVEVWDLSPGVGNSRLENISTRGQVGAIDDVMIAGFIIEGSNPKRVLVNGLGPSLSAFGVPGVLANPSLRLFSGSTEIGANDDWTSASNASEIAATGRAPANSREAAFLVVLSPGTYTAHLAGVGSGVGNGLIEVWEEEIGLSECASASAE